MPWLLVSTARNAGPVPALSPALALAKYSTEFSFTRSVRIADPVSARHCSSPVAVSSAYKVPSVLPTYSVLPITTGRLRTADPLS